MREDKKRETIARAHSERRKTGEYILYAALVLMAAVSLYNLSLVSQSNRIIDEKIKYSLSLAGPANLEVIKIVPSCPDCPDVSGIINAIRLQFKANVSEKDLDSSSLQARSLIGQYNITKLPTIIVTGETEKAGLPSKWSGIGTIERDGALVMRSAFAPFIELPSGEVRGKTDIIYLNDTSCSACYDVTQHKAILKGNFAMFFSSEKTVDISSAEGKALIERYNITKVPTVLLSPDARYYEPLKAVWSQVGSVEKDGWFVFRSMESIQRAVYYDLVLKKEQGALNGG